ncbi:hypothetical protein [Haloferula sp.]|uniref:hypothetical protein n=1 Tax=Haloferula sp. TaxID=2497595 RepID=UPI00329E01B4
METPESIERMLEKRLVPSAFSVEGSAALEELIDDLAEESPKAPLRWGRYLLGAVAAAVAMFAAIMVTIPSGEVTSVVGVDELFSEPQDVILLEDVEGVVSAQENEVLVADADGSLHRAWHVHVVSEERFHDEESGDEIRIVHPRDELVLMPVTTF